MPTDVIEPQARLLLPSNLEGTAMEKVLIVDDNNLFRKLLREILQSRMPSLILSEAKDRKEAMEIIRTSLPDLILMGIRLPDGNVFEVTHQIKKRHRGVKIVILTDSDQPDYRGAAFRYKADHYVAKDTFMAMLSSILPKTF
jgi:DNA-binding NarL/FixJ family response regulator